MEKKLKFKDYFALYQLSLRDYFWRVDGRQTMNRIRGGDYMNAAYLFGMFIAYGLPICVLFCGVNLIKSVLLAPLRLLGILPAVTASGLGSSFLLALFLFAVFSPVTLNFDRAKYNLRFKTSNWWKNTGITPSQIKRDKGLYGEYIATMATEKCLENSGIYGRVFNSVIIPTVGEDFNEIDLISVNEAGIHVIEAKAKGGSLRGDVSGHDWYHTIGSEEHIMFNPILQNAGHIRTLSRYLRTALPGEAIDERDYINVVMFCLSGIEGHFNYDNPPSEYFLGMADGEDGYRNTNILEVYGRRFTKEEVDRIADAIAALPTYTYEQIQEKVRQREARRNGQ